jgi:hypothetical protein
MGPFTAQESSALVRIVACVQEAFSSERLLLFFHFNFWSNQLEASKNSERRLTGTVSGVHGTHIFIRWKDRTTFYAQRAELNFSDPCLRLEVSFMPGKQPTPVSLPYALQVQKA